MQFSQDFSSLPPKYFPHDFPQVPKCFLHLLRSSDSSGVEESNASFNMGIVEEEGRSNNYKHSAHASGVISHHIKRSNSLSKSRSRSRSASSDLTCPESVVKPVKSEAKNFCCQDASNGSKIIQSERAVKAVQDCESDREKRQLLGRLNSSLSELKKEMTDLRSLDVSLLFQLLSLHDAIQDFKMTVGDRFSETGSEYSLESASYMGSMSSLSEEDIDLMDSQQKDLDDSQVFVNNQSASSLLDQITALVQKADADF